jgi:hypothetical protein
MAEELMKFVVVACNFTDQPDDESLGMTFPT